MTWKRIPIVVAVLAVTASPAWCYAPYANLLPREVQGLHKVLRQVRVNGNVSREINPKGGHVGTNLVIDTCPAIADPWNTSWTCYGKIIGTFRLTGKRNWTTGVGDGSVTVENSAAGDKLKYTEQITYDWNAAQRRLTVVISYGNPFEHDARAIQSTYNVQGTSLTTVTSSSKGLSTSIDLSSTGTLGVKGSVSQAKDVKTSRLNVLLDGNPYVFVEGVFIVDKTVPNQTDFVTSMLWSSDALVDYNEQVTQSHAQCGAKYDTNFSGTFNAEKLSGGVKYDSKSGVTCSASSEGLAAHVYWRARPAFTSLGCLFGGCASAPAQSVGQGFWNKIRVRQPTPGQCKSLYQAIFTSVTTWQLDVETAGGQNGGGFEVGSRHQVFDQLAPAFPATTPLYPCS